MSLLRHTLQITFLAFRIAYTSAQTMCYFPDGTEASAEVPCSGLSIVPCCPKNAICLTNGLCWETNRLFRGSCSDKGWTDPNCPEYCSQFSRSTGKVLAPCNSNNLYTCNYDCSDSNLTVPSGNISLRDYQVSSVLSAFSASSSSLLAVSTASKSSSPSSTSTSPPSSGILDENCTISSADQPPTTKSPRLAAVAAGIAVPLGLLWLATLFCFGRERRKTRLLEQENSLLTGSAKDYQQEEWNGYPEEQGEGNAGMKENRAHEMAGKPMGSELQA